jgi:hypothetical protein
MGIAKPTVCATLLQAAGRADDTGGIMNNPPKLINY